VSLRDSKRNGFEEPREVRVLRTALRASAAVEQLGGRVRRTRSKVGFPLFPPTVPRGVEVPAKPKRTGADFDTAWARTPPARYARTAIVEGPLKAAVRLAAAPTIEGLDRLSDLQRRAERAVDDDGDLPVVFAANHSSHLDAPLMLTSIPLPWRRKVVVGAAADYFFGNRVTGTASALALSAFPIERSKVNRRSADLGVELLRDGWSLIIFPEGGRSPDGWGQPFKGGAAFLALRAEVPVVPVHIEGSGAIWGRGTGRIRPGTVRVTFGTPLVARDGEDARRFGARIEQAVAELNDEVLDGWWVARQRAAQRASSAMTGPETESWRRSWALSERRRAGGFGRTRASKRTWPKI
jgi:1-acyl-sn-glycerol-3-phosphate acyltransferase